MVKAAHQPETRAEKAAAEELTGLGGAGAGSRDLLFSHIRLIKKLFNSSNYNMCNTVFLKIQLKEPFYLASLLL